MLLCGQVLGYTWFSVCLWQCSWDEINIWIHRLSKADCAPSCGWAPPSSQDLNSTKVSPAQRREDSSCLQNGTETLALPGSRASRLRLELHHWRSRDLSVSITKFLCVYMCTHTHTHTHTCLSGEPWQIQGQINIWGMKKQVKRGSHIKSYPFLKQPQTWPPSSRHPEILTLSLLQGEPLTFWLTGPFSNHTPHSTPGTTFLFVPNLPLMSSLKARAKS